MNKEKIKELRIKLFMTQELFAKALNVSFGTIQSWEHGVSIPSLRNQKKIYELCKENGIDIN